MSLRRLMYVHTDLAAVFVLLLPAALIELACGASLGGDIQIWFANPAAGFFFIVSLCVVWSVIRFERRFV